jgi:hypothetical protein
MVNYCMPIISNLPYYTCIKIKCTIKQYITWKLVSQEVCGKTFQTILTFMPYLPQTQHRVHMELTAQKVGVDQVKMLLMEKL